MKKNLIIIWIATFSFIFFIKVVLNSNLFWQKKRDVFQFHKIYDSAGDGIEKPHYDSLKKVEYERFIDSIFETRTVNLSMDSGSMVIEVFGTRLIDDIEKEVKVNKISLNYLFYKRGIIHKMSEGVVVVGFSINHLGHTLESEIISTSINDTVFIHKVKSDILQWRFPVLKESGQISKVIYPLYFKIKQEI
jgi:hypothetical protein